jgi:ribosomal protein L16 Arg81 hydroxylase
MSDGTQHAWEELLNPHDKHDFQTTYFEKKYLHVPRRNPEHYSALFSKQEVEKLFADRTFRFPSLRLTKQGEEIQSSEYCTEKCVDMVQVRKRFSEGYTIILNSLHEQHPALRDLTNALAVCTGHPFQTNVYITPPESQGFPAHYDTHDVFVLQVAGNKTWRIYRDSSIELPSKTMEFNAKEHHPGTEFDEIQLKQGDLLYVPRGVYHDALAESDLSIHVTLGMLNYTWTDLIIQLVLERSKQHPAWRKSLPLQVSNEINMEENARFFSTLLDDLCEHTNLQTSFNHFKENLLRNLPISIPVVLDYTHRLTNVHATTKLQHHPLKVFTLVKDEGIIGLEWAGYRVTFPSHTESAIRYILNHKVFQMLNLPKEMDEESNVVLVKRLLKEDFLQIVPTVHHLSSE